MSCSAWPDPLLQGNGNCDAQESHRGQTIQSSLKIHDVNFCMREKRTRHCFLERSLCHAFTRISCGLFVKELVIPQCCELGAPGMSGLQPVLSMGHRLPAGCLKKGVISGLAFNYWYCLETYSLYET